MKTAKRILMDNTGPGGSLNTDKVSMALLQYLNTPLRDINKSPAQLATGRQLRDGVPALKQHYRVNIHWQKSLRDREVQMAETNDKLTMSGETHRTLPPMDAGERVYVQNLNTLKWDRSGTIHEVLDNRQYTVVLDGSGRLSRRNRRHLKSINEPAAAGDNHIPTTAQGNTANTQQVSCPHRERRKPDRFTH